jgi:hypothetical protein
MKSRTARYALLIFLLVVLGGAWLFSAWGRQESLPIFPATVGRDCAPWDGPAFTVSIPVEESVIVISMSRAPDRSLPVTFSFPDETMRAGNAFLLLPAGLPEQLTGNVTFWRVDPGLPVEGTFAFRSETGGQFEGRFKAEWDRQPVYCG